MACKIEVTFTPAEFRQLAAQDLAGKVCVVFDVLRATSTFITALANGAAAVIPVEDIAEALALRFQHPDALLAGERNGLRIGAALTGGVEFDLGNSPREQKATAVSGKVIIATTTNGTRALRACRKADTVFAGSFLNLTATVEAVLQQRPRHVLLVGAGTGESAALEDTLAAGAFCAAMMSRRCEIELLDSAGIALDAFRQVAEDLPAAIRRSQNARRLLSHKDLKADVEVCLQLDVYAFAAFLASDGSLTRRD